MSRYISFEPYGDNDLPSDFLYIQRKYYKTSEDIYPTVDRNNKPLPKPIDMWYDKPLYGKVDPKGRVVYPKASILKDLNGELKALSFVVDAYRDFSIALYNASVGLRTSASSIIDFKNPKKAWQNVTLDHHDIFFDLINERFILFLEENNLLNIDNFEVYLQQFLGFVRDNNLFVSKPAFILSTKTSNRSSGMIIEFEVRDYDDDRMKWRDFISNEFFPDFVKLTSLYGFYVDRNIPWSIVANLNSKAMKKYMNQNTIISVDNLFENYFYNAEILGFEIFKSQLFASYVTFISNNPDKTIYKVKQCNNGTVFGTNFTTKVRKIKKELEFQDGTSISPSYEEFERRYSDKHLLDYYLDIRLMESNIKEPEKSRIKKKIIKISSIQGIESALGYFSYVSTKSLDKPKLL